MTNSLKEIGFLIKSRLINSCLTLPKINDWIWVVILLFILAFITIPLGFKLKFLKVEFPQIPKMLVCGMILTTLFFPAIAEEIFFRGLLLPHKVELASLTNQLISGSISLILFIVYHPLNAFLFVKNARETFSDFVFLLSATFLAIACSFIYLKSGCIYPSIIIHWIFVIVWLLGLGGYQKNTRILYKNRGFYKIRKNNITSMKIIFLRVLNE
ncbi:Abortive infection protein [[Leptolyngbya] sp. PCC 7376]|uniref:CPBP family glutamic-type intramembrane protease n=1 Tax=[Leptolyngbya] sp. PCC 7376 TaxID=111781 RepID=UPI00029EC3F1|nr:CPBP family glutamic-type intramembrane protease [[Leptolyngbya] sp. PCC 7376]AFY38959.1 Abortive infection protein [[Leptolyngbya] sp. PCC 7376]